MIVLALLIAAVVLAVIGLVTVAKWLLIIAGVLLLIGVVTYILDHTRRTRL